MKRKIICFESLILTIPEALVNTRTDFVQEVQENGHEFETLY